LKTIEKPRQWHRAIPDCIPPDPKEVQSSRTEVSYTLADINDIGMKYAKNPCVAEWVCTSSGLGVEHHDVTMRLPKMNHIFVTADIIGCKVEPHNLVIVDAPVVEQDGIPVEVYFVV
jgi:hypothetical protein